MTQRLVLACIAVATLACAPSTPPVTTGNPPARMPEPPMRSEPLGKPQRVSIGRPMPGSGLQCAGGSAGSELRLFPASVADSALVGADRGQIVVRTDSSDTDRPLPFVRVALLSATAVQNTATTDDHGLAILEPAAPGQYSLRLYRLQYDNREFSVNVRRGFADTLRAGLGALPICRSY